MSRAPIPVLHAVVGLGTGGAQSALVRLATAGSPALAHEVVTLMAGGRHRETLEAAGVPVAALGIAQGALRPTAALALARLLRARPDHLLQGWMYHANIALTLAAPLARHRRPLVWNIRHAPRDLAGERPLTRLLIRLGARLSRRPAAIVYNARESARLHERLGYDAARSRVIPNGFDTLRFRPDPEAGPRLRALLGLAEAPLLVGCVARLHPMKDHGTLLAAAARLVAAGRDLHLVLIGDGEPDHVLAVERAIGGQGLCGRVTLMGGRGYVERVLPGLDLLALSSAFGESFPNVLGEAMAAGVPCIATDLGDCAWIVGASGAGRAPGVVEGEAGLIAPPGEPEAFAAGLDRLAGLGAEGRRRMGAAGRARIQAELTLSRMVERYERLYADLAARA